MRDYSKSYFYQSSCRFRIWDARSLNYFLLCLYPTWYRVQFSVYQARSRIFFVDTLDLVRDHVGVCWWAYLAPIADLKLIASVR